MNTVTDANGTPLRLQIATEALRILDNTQQTSYQHNIFIDEATGTYDVDCSGFVSYVLGRVAPNQLKLIPISGSETRLLAHDYYTFFSSLPTETDQGWRQILHLRHARRGDLIAWILPPPNRDTGHIFMVATDPVFIADDTLAIMAYDASDITHYDDSRGSGETGVGSGTFHLKIDSDGKPVAFQFDTNDKFFFEKIAIGRIELA